MNNKKKVNWGRIREECDQFDQSEFWPHLRADEDHMAVMREVDRGSVAPENDGESEES